jgi:hypothetical protein
MGYQASSQQLLAVKQEHLVTKCYAEPRNYGSCEHGNDISGSIKGEKSFD